MNRPLPPAGADADAALLAAYAAGDAQAAALLAARLLPRSLRLAARLLGDPAEAEDVAQEAMLRLWRAAPGWRADGGARVETWLHRVVVNLATDRLRRRGRTRPLEDAPDPIDPQPSAEAGLIAQGRAAALNAALGRLPERQRIAVVLRHLEALSNPEIAAILDTGVEAVESLLARARRALAADPALRHDIDPDSNPDKEG
ncbi:MAG: sigma-70 family RNA polymerase sigma factor [Gemmobacter sp.]|jgi:RNA polymerase sigma factor (sigma-70 family)